MKFGGKVTFFEEGNRNATVFDFELQEATSEKAREFYQSMKHINIKNTREESLFPGYTFSQVNYRIAIQEYEKEADASAKRFEELKIELGEEQANRKEFEDV